LLTPAKPLSPHPAVERGLPIMDCIYLDNNATTPTHPSVWEAMRPYLTSAYGNPASAHQVGRRARRALEDARERTAALLHAHPDEVVFTSGATEANNLALFGLCGEPPAHLLTSPVEHPSVGEPLHQLLQLGFTVDYLPVDRAGVVRLEALQEMLRPETRLVSVMLANHETGSVQPVGALVERLAGRAVCHCDAVQAVGKIPIDFHALGVTALTLSAHKFHGPQGAGALLLRRGSKLRPRAWGGHQQRGQRPGTEPVALAVGLAAALEVAHAEMDPRRETVMRLRTRFLTQLRSSLATLVLNGPEDGGIPHTINVSFPGLKADALLINLDLAGVACSTGSACSSGSLLPSPVLQAMGMPEDVLHSAMRFSLSSLLTEAEIDEAARRVVGVVRRLRLCQAGIGVGG
jgi:cysteine desulfurase